MRRLIAIAFCVVPLAAQPSKKTESFWDKLLRIAGVSATPAALRGNMPVASGDIWVVTVAPNPVPQRLTRGGGYNSPVFDSRSLDVLALRNGDLYRVPLAGGPPVKLYSISGVNKLVGVSLDDPDELLALASDGQGSPTAVLVSLRTGALTRVPHNPLSNEDRAMLAHLAGWERVYGAGASATRVYVEKNEREGAGGAAIEFTDVYLKRGSELPMNLTNGNGASSSQPSLSRDGLHLVFVHK